MLSLDKVPLAQERQAGEARAMERTWPRAAAALGAAACLAACLVVLAGAYQSHVDLVQNARSGATREGDPMLDDSLDGWGVAMAGEQPCQETMHDMAAGVCAVARSRSLGLDFESMCQRQA